MNFNLSHSYTCTHTYTYHTHTTNTLFVLAFVLNFNCLLYKYNLFRNEFTDSRQSINSHTNETFLSCSTPRNSESDSESSSKDYEIISSSEVQNVAGN